MLATLVKAIFQPVICRHVLDGLSAGFGKETILDDDIRNYVGKLSDETGCDSGKFLSIFGHQ